MKIRHLLITSLISLLAFSSYATDARMIAYMYQNDDGESAVITLTKQNSVIVVVFKAGENQNVIEIDEKTFSQIANQLDSMNLEQFSTKGSKGNMDKTSHIILSKEIGEDGQKIGMFQIPREKADSKLKNWITTLKNLNKK